MKPAAFEYFAPTSLAEALELLWQHGDDATVLAGGQSLVPMLNLRLARPAVIVDINRVQELDYVSETADHGVSVGAMARERSVELSPTVRDRNPLLSAAMPLIGHFQIRNRGTVGGSIAHAHPAAELPAVAVALGAELVANGGSERTIDAEDFFQSYFTTDLGPTELLTEVRIPAWPEGRGWGLEEVSRRHGDFAIVGAIALLQVTNEDICVEPRLVLFGVDEHPVRARLVEEAIAGRVLDAPLVNEVGEIAAEAVDPETDVHASSEYRREVASVLTKRVLSAALERASQTLRAS